MNENASARQHPDTGRIWCAVPVYNNAATLRTVVEGCIAELPGRVLVIDDGCTDADVASLLAGLDAALIRHQCNQGKGQAVLSASRYVEEHGGTYMITIDADGQHDPRDIRKFIPLMQQDEISLIVGARDFSGPNIPGSSRFGRKFANFWLKLETGEYIDDCQSGFRAYPVKYLNLLKFKGRHYDFEAEVLAKASWAGLHLRSVDIAVYYPKPEERVSSFRPFMDNLRLTLVHSMLIGMRLAPFSHKRLIAAPKVDYSMLLNPMKLIRYLLSENMTPGGLAAAAAVGTFLAVIPILFLHSAAILYVSIRLKLNKLVALNVQHIFMPPFTPALCIELGYYMRYGKWLTDLTFSNVFMHFHERLYEWLLGSLIVAPVATAAMAALFYAAGVVYQRRTLKRS